MLSGLFKPKLVIRNVLAGKEAAISEFPVFIGGTGAHFEVEEGDRALVEIRSFEKGLVVASLGEPMIAGGVEKQEANLAEGDQCSIVIGGHFLLLSFTKKGPELLKKWGRDSWRIVDSDSNVLAGPFKLSAAERFVPKVYSENPDAIFHQTSSTSGLYLGTVMQLLGLQAYEPRASEEQSSVYLHPDAAGIQSPAGIPTPEIDVGEFTCPYCWLKFDRGDVMHVAVHKSLQGDNLLGEEHMLRFLASSFNDKAQALDAMGSPCTDLACPHCHSKLPPGFLDLKPKILSIVGAPSSGKSYYLSVLVKMLERTLYKNFGIAFYDADPSENSRLTLMKNRLFSGATAAEAQLSKTALEGDMYVEVSRLGRKVRMPKPFIFTVSPNSDASRATSIVFYDNAGEHFEPGANKADSPGAQHIAAAEGIFFLFDPTYNLEFRRILQGISSDPQIKDKRFDQQETLLAEMNSRVKGLMGVDFRDKISKPLAVVVGKCDVWQEMIGRENLKNAVNDGELDLDVIKNLSDLVRAKLLEITPAIVANAESISDNVMYFPVSSFGCSPELLGTDPASGHPILSPDPHKIAPILVEIPTLWILSQMNRKLVPSKGGR
jgi:hypothetical protein